MVYIVEDDTYIREMESYALKSSGFEVKGFSKSTPFYSALKNEIPALIILDIMLPEEDGLSILKNLRSAEATKHIPVIIVTAKTSEFDKIKGLEMGSDDYITKPFGVMELVARVKAVLRRAAPKEDSKQVYTYENLELNDLKHIVRVDKKEVELTYKEYELLKLLLVNKGLVLSRDKIMNLVWDTDYEGETRTVDMHINTLRKKIKDNGDIIKTVRNVGYKIG